MDETDKYLVHKVNNSSGEFHGWMIFCPACRQGHVFDKRWKFNDDRLKPTFTPSMLVYGDEKTRKETDGRYGQRCHSFVTDGKIKLLSDCTHEKAGQTLDLEPF